MMMKAISVRFLLLLYLTFLPLACQPDRSNDEPIDGAAEPISADPITFVGHGAMFDSNGEEIEATPEFVVRAQTFYLRTLLAVADGQQRALFEQKRERLFGANQWNASIKLYANAELIDWLIKEVRPADADKLTAHNKLIQLALARSGFETAPSAPTDGTSFEVPEELRARLVEEGLAGAEVEHGVTILKATAAGGAAYINECVASGVPIPPAWGTSQWVSRGVLTNEFISESLDAEVFTYQSNSPAGMCIALPRASGNSIQLLGIICLGKTSSNACFWDNQMPGSSFPIQKGTVVPLSQFFGGANLQKNVGGECTDCHAGENPYIIHPNTVLGQPNLSGLPLRADNWYTPLVRADWSQNVGPTNILAGVSSPGQCTTCHTQTAGGRFPSVSTALPAYCSIILPKAFARTMPPGAVGSSAYKNHYDALITACQQPPAGDPLPWHQVAPNPLASDPAAVSWGSNRIDVFARGTDGQMYSISWDGSQWTGWSSLGGQFTSGPAVASWGVNRLDVFGRGTDNALWTNSWTGASWSGWSQVAPNPIASDPAAVSWGPNRIDVFARGTDNQMYSISWDGSQWTGWSSLGGQFTSGPAVASWGVNRLDVFGRGTDNALWTKSWTGSSWD